MKLLYTLIKKKNIYSENQRSKMVIPCQEVLGLTMSLHRRAIKLKVKQQD